MNDYQFLKRDCSMALVQVPVVFALCELRFLTLIRLFPLHELPIQWTLTAVKHTLKCNIYVYGLKFNNKT
jgi:hypothetical protein